MIALCSIECDFLIVSYVYIVANDKFLFDVISEPRPLNCDKSPGGPYVPIISTNGDVISSHSFSDVFTGYFSAFLKTSLKRTQFVLRDKLY
jgi:hypothetical protein